MIGLFGKAARVALIAGALMMASCSRAPNAPSAQKTEFSIGWSIYAGWMPWPYAQQAGIVKKWADRYGIKINVVQVNDYVESGNQYTAGKFDGVTVANMDALTIPAAGGKDTSAIIVGDYSNGNDGILLKGADSLAAIKGRQVYLVELSVSHYLLARALEKAGLKPTDVRTVNTSDADIVGAFGSPDANAVVAWNPPLSGLEAQPGAKVVFSSAQIPGQLLDLLRRHTATLTPHPNPGQAQAGIWYETAARAAAASAPQLITTMKQVRDFSFSKGLFKGAASADAVGMAFPGGKTLGDPARVTLRFDESFMKLAADGKL